MILRAEESYTQVQRGDTMLWDVLTGEKATGSEGC